MYNDDQPQQNRTPGMKQQRNKDMLGVNYWEEKNPISGEIDRIRKTEGGFTHTTENGGSFFVSSDD
jgi:hypothetical protein